MKKLILFFSFLITIFALSTGNTYAEQKASGSSAVLATSATTTRDDARVKVLRKFLEKYNSPLSPYAKTFVESADKNSLDWKFVAAISGLESTFGQQIPYGTYNAWGWGVYGDNRIYFTSWEDGIQTVSQGLKERYIDAWGARDTYEIGSMYASSPTWAVRVEYFMSAIEAFRLKNPQDVLSISI
jgi:hypothetical protein